MAKVLTATLLPNFADNPSGTSVPLTIQGDPGAFGDDFIHLILIPAVGAILRASVGTIQTGIVKAVNVPGGLATFSGSNTTSFPKPPVFSNPVFTVLYSNDLKGNPTSVGIHYDPVTFQLKASKPCFAAVAFTPYQTSGLPILYSPKVSQLGGGVAQEFGTIAAFFPPSSQTSFVVQPPDVDEGNIELELYRRVSFAVTTPDGEFEQPPGYPGTGSYPDKPLVIDVGTSLRTERVHEIGLMDGRGRGWVRNFFVPIKEPYVGDPLYPATLEAAIQCKISTLSSGQFSNNLILKAKNFVAEQGYGCS